MTDDEMRHLVGQLAKINGLTVPDMAKTVVEGEEIGQDEGRWRPWRRGVWITFASVGLVFGFCIIFLMRIVSGPVVAGPSGLEAAKQSLAPSPPALATLNGLHIAFSYPSKFTRVSRVPGNPAGLEQYTLDSSGIDSARIAASVENLPSGDMHDDSGYTFREKVSKDYEKDVAKVGGEPAILMRKNDGSERTLYWLHKGKLVIISITGSSTGDLGDYMKTVDDTLRWVG